MIFILELSVIASTERALSLSATEDVFKIENEIFGKNSPVFCVSAQIPIMKYRHLITIAELVMTLKVYFW